jgi:hypothetical protein
LAVMQLRPGGKIFFFWLLANEGGIDEIGLR